jgi:hypothetical protein
MGEIRIPASRLMQSKFIDEWFEVQVTKLIFTMENNNTKKTCHFRIESKTNCLFLKPRVGKRDRVRGSIRVILRYLSDTSNTTPNNSTELSQNVCKVFVSLFDSILQNFQFTGLFIIWYLISKEKKEIGNA